MASLKISYEELANKLKGCPQIGSLWRHYKGGRYMVMANAILESTQEPAVVYRKIDTAVSFTRPLAEWQENVDNNGFTQPRFTQFGD